MQRIRGLKFRQQICLSSSTGMLSIIIELNERNPIIVESVSTTDCGRVDVGKLFKGLSQLLFGWATDPPARNPWGHRARP